jgi:uncharacterized membrane protein YbhN (UPF0104 family)
VKRFMLAMVLIGIALLGVIVYHTDLGEVWAHLRQIPAWGLLLLFAVYFVGVTAEAASWQLTLPSLPPTPRWWHRFWKVAMAGVALENVTPLDGMGGEPIKAIVMKRHYGVPYRWPGSPSWRSASHCSSGCNAGGRSRESATGSSRAGWGTA